MSYLTLPELNTYMTTDPSVNTEWATLTDIEKSNYLDIAEYWLDREFQYCGRAINPKSGKAFPRDFDALIEDKTDLNDPLVLYNKKLPRQVQDSVAEITKALLLSVDLKQLETLKSQLGTESVSISSISIGMGEGGYKLGRAKGLLSPFLLVNYSFKNIGM